MFYEFQNGWVHATSDSLGISPVENLFLLEDEEWGIIENKEVTIDFDMKSTVAIFSNGMGSYVCITMGSKSEGMIFWKHKAPTRNIGLWEVIDTWTYLGFMK